MLRRRCDAQTQTARKTERGQKADETRRQRGYPPRSLHGNFGKRGLIYCRGVAVNDIVGGGPSRRTPGGKPTMVSGTGLVVLTLLSSISSSACGITSLSLSLAISS